jgi:hypothetical protein
MRVRKTRAALGSVAVALLTLAVMAPVAMAGNGNGNGNGNGGRVSSGLVLLPLGMLALGRRRRRGSRKGA